MTIEYIDQKTFQRIKNSNDETLWEIICDLTEEHILPPVFLLDHIERSKKQIIIYDAGKNYLDCSYIIRERM